MQDELALARYEAQKWKEKYLTEKQRRRTISKNLLELMVLPERHSATSSARPSSSAFSDIDHLGDILSPTLSSFDFDDDNDESESSDGSDGDASFDDDDEESAPIYADRSSGRSYPSPTARDVHETDGFNEHLMTPSDRSSELMTSRVRPSRSSTTGSLDMFRSPPTSRKGDADGGGSSSSQTPPPSLLYRMMYSKSSSRDLWQARSHPAKFSTIARSLMFSMHLRKERIFENFFVAGLTIGAVERAHAAKSATGLVGYWKPRVLYEYPHVCSSRSTQPCILSVAR